MVETTAPAFGSVAPKTSVPMRACTSAPTHIRQGSIVTYITALGEPVVADATRRVAERHDLRVRGGIDGANRLIESASDDLSVEDDDRADGDLAGGLGAARFVQREPHELLVILHDAIIQAG